MSCQLDRVSQQPTTVASQSVCREYDTVEIMADGMVHACGVALATVGAVTLEVVTNPAPGLGTAACAIYAAGLIVTFTMSAAYHLWPLSTIKSTLRRFDHVAIYLFIAATAMPLLVHMRVVSFRDAALGLVWLGALSGAMLRLMLPERLELFCISFCFFLGAVALCAAWLGAGLSGFALELIILGGTLYAIGVFFLLSDHLRFHIAAWHVFVLLAASCHYFAILSRLSAVLG